MEKYRSALEKLADALEQVEEHRLAAMVREQAKADDSGLTTFLTSNELWGGAGSIADQAGIKDRKTNRSVEQAMIELGELQANGSLVNARTTMWTSVFKEWRSKGV